MLWQSAVCRGKKQRGPPVSHSSGLSRLRSRKSAGLNQQLLRRPRSSQGQSVPAPGQPWALSSSFCLPPRGCPGPDDRNLASTTQISPGSGDFTTLSLTFQISTGTETTARPSGIGAVQTQVKGRSRWATIRLRMGVDFLKLSSSSLVSSPSPKPLLQL